MIESEIKNGSKFIVKTSNHPGISIRSGSTTGFQPLIVF